MWNDLNLLPDLCRRLRVDSRTSCSVAMYNIICVKFGSPCRSSSNRCCCWLSCSASPFLMEQMLKSKQTLLIDANACIQSCIHLEFLTSFLQIHNSCIPSKQKSSSGQQELLSANIALSNRSLFNLGKWWWTASSLSGWTTTAAPGL